jgi:hypothetical protein
MLRIGFRCLNRALGLLALGAGVLTSGVAGAQTAPAPAVPVPNTPEAAPDQPAPSAPPDQPIQLTKKKPMIDVSTPPPAPPEGRTYHVHDGFSVRANFGAGAIFGKASSDAGGSGASTGGLSLNYDLLIGGSPSPGFTLGGGISGSLQLSGNWELDDDVKVGSGNLSTFIIGPFAEGYPNANSGLHFGGMVGFARLGADVSSTTDSISALGAGGAFWMGSGLWVAPDWSVGGLVRIDGATGKDGDTSVSAGCVSVMFSVLYN